MKSYPTVTVVYSDGVAFTFFPNAARPWLDKDVKRRAFFLRTLALGSIADVVAVLRREPTPVALPPSASLKPIGIGIAV